MQAVAAVLSLSLLLLHSKLNRLAYRRQSCKKCTAGLLSDFSLMLPEVVFHQHAALEPDVDMQTFERTISTAVWGSSF